VASSLRFPALWDRAPLALAAASLFISLPSQADTPEGDAARLDTVVVTATRSPEPSFDVAASVTSIGDEGLHGASIGISVADALQSVPGVVARDRQNYAQDTQISIRGFGARSAFGIRGVRLYVDGIPATQPDGQGQVSHFNLASAERVEVLRGPYSALYGNSSGGVIQLFTADGGDKTRAYAGTAVGEWQTWRASVGVRSPLGENADVNVDYTSFSTDGYRDHSAAERSSFNGKLNYRLGSSTDLTLLLNAFDAPLADDPLGLTREQFDADPRQADAAATTYDTRKDVAQTQGGLVLEHRFGSANTIRATAYTGTRDVWQVLSIPDFVQASPTHSGGVVDLANEYSGGDLRWRWAGGLGGRELAVTAGLTYDVLDQHRRGYENFIGDTLGVQGALRRDEDNQVDNFDQYLQFEWSVAESLDLMAGVRHSKVKIDSDDHYVTDGNVDDSGSTDFDATTPVVGLTWHVTPILNAYATYGTGFETPTLAEVAYRPDGGAGLNLDLDPARSDNAEVGAKLRLSSRFRGELALFHSKTKDELVVATSSGGRTTYANGGDATRKGVELSTIATLPLSLSAEASWTWLDATINGNDLVGVPKSSLYAALRWTAPMGLSIGVDARSLSAVPVDDANTAAAPSYTVAGAELRLPFQGARLGGQAFLRVDNLFDEDYVGSVIVNDRNGRYYEPAPGRNVLAGLRLDWTV